MDKAKEREVIAEHLYDEHRVTTFRTAGYSPMWHELEGVEQSDWMRRAARLQVALETARKVERQMKARTARAS